MPLKTALYRAVAALAQIRQRLLRNYWVFSLWEMSIGLQ